MITTMITIPMTHNVKPKTFVTSQTHDDRPLHSVTLCFAQVDMLGMAETQITLHDPTWAQITELANELLRMAMQMAEYQRKEANT